MTIKELMLEIQNHAINIDGIHSVKIGDIYDILNNKQCVYPAIVLTPSTVDLGEDVNTVNVMIYYVDRLIQNQSNQLDVYSNTVIALNDLIDDISKEDDIINVEIPTLQLYSQQFGDYCAGGYVELGVSTKVEKNCR